MIESDRIILKKLFIMWDYVRKLCEQYDVNDEFVVEMDKKIGYFKSKLSFRYRRRDEIPLRYLASKL